MHATIEQLLVLRDSEQRGGSERGSIRRHVEQCAECRSELERLFELRDRLRALPEVEPPRRLWPAIAEASRRQRASKVNGIRWGIAASLLVATMLVGALVGRNSNQDSASLTSLPGDRDVTVNENGVTVTVDIELGEMIERSQRLETLLQRLPRRPNVVRAGTDGTIDSLKNSIAMVDYTLSQADGLTSDQSLQLWEQRVGLMDSLVKVRYAEASQASL